MKTNLKKSPIKVSQLQLLNPARVEKLRKELGMDALVVIGFRGGTVIGQQSRTCPHDILFASQYLLSELEQEL